MTTNVCVSGMECVCARPDGVRMCIWDAVCAHLRARVTGHKPVCLCVSLGVSQRGSGCRDGVLEGVCFGWGYRECSNPEAPDRAGVSACGAVSSPCPPPPHQGWARGARTLWLLLPLTLTHSLTKISLAGGSQPPAAWPGMVPGPPVAGTPRTPARGVPPGEGGGAGPRRGASPGTPGRAPGGQSGPPPAAPPSSRGSSLHWGGGPPRASTQRAYRVRPCPGVVPLGL